MDTVFKIGNGPGIGVADLTGPVADRYLSLRRAAGYAEYRSVKALQPLLDYLAALGVLPDAAEVAPGPVEELLVRYRCWLLQERGLTAGTARGYVDCVRPFVATRLHGDRLDLAGVAVAYVIGFVLSVCPGRAVRSAKLIVCSLQSLLRWLHMTGIVSTPLAAAVPSVAGWQLSSPLAACGRRTPTGRRDYAIMPLSRMGLRAGEVAPSDAVIMRQTRPGGDVCPADQTWGRCFVGAALSLRRGLGV